MQFYYAADGFTTSSKISAREHGEKTGKPVSFYYHDLEYARVNWTTEPPETLAYYYQAQAQRLRDKYDYLILCYSGGYDSTNILETFHFNGIKLDKIVIVGALSQDRTSGVDDNYNGELYHNAFPYVESLGLAAITETFDYTTLFSDISKNLTIMQYGDDWVDQMGGWYSPHHWVWRDIERFVIPKDIGSKKVGLIFGVDKPTLHDSEFRFLDVQLSGYGNIRGADNCDRINFYWDPGYPEVLLKQLHTLRRYQQAGYKVSTDIDAGAQTFGSVSINRLVYDLKRPLVFKSPKSRSFLLSRRDQYLLGCTDSEVVKRLTSGLWSALKRVGSSITRPFASKGYRICT